MKGFTLIESLVVVFIILVLTLATLPNYRRGEKTLSLEQSSAKLSQDLRRVEGMALSAKEFRGIIPRGGYGIYAALSASLSYILFADCDQNYQYSFGALACNGYPEKMEEITLGSGVQITSLTPSSPLNVVFAPPFPTVTISLSASEATIVLSLKDDVSKTQTIKANKAGLIETY